MKLDQLNDQHDIEQLAMLTPFEKKDYQSKINFKSGNLFVESNVLESAQPLEVWNDCKQNS
ncbi:hypothetical protein NIES3806_16860 [Microcystis aeruginosa NIES-3806]|uniref:hypothetical protein n=1 Tax=Microcystis aeruginosa TaxID=1126 RepID=UPI00130A3CDE|nr:hypothetical protein [Microcystis aeruginosa]GCL54347.1 hypothetical protein NIES3806_16860 [Microcystis aeruginosa NIES-3806]